MNSNLNLSALPECKFAYQMVNSALLIPCAEYQRMLWMEKVSQIAENFSEYIANEPKVSYRDGRFYVFDGQNTVEARRTCNGGKDVTIRCKVFYSLTKEDEATLFAIQTGNATCLTAGERLRANLVAENPDALYFVGITSNAGVEFAYDGIRAPWKIYCIETAYELYKQYGCERYVEMLHIINEAWKGNVDAYLAGVIRGVPASSLYTRASTAGSAWCSSWQGHIRKPSRSWLRKTPEVLQTATCGRFFASITVPAVR